MDSVVHFWGENRRNLPGNAAYFPGTLSQPGDPLSGGEAGGQQPGQAPALAGRCGRSPCRPVSPAAAGCAAGWPWAGAGARRQRPPRLPPLRSSACLTTTTWTGCRCSGPRSGLSEMTPRTPVTPRSRLGSAWAQAWGWPRAGTRSLQP